MGYSTHTTATTTTLLSIPGTLLDKQGMGRVSYSHPRGAGSQGCCESDPSRRPLSMIPLIPSPTLPDRATPAPVPSDTATICNIIALLLRRSGLSQAEVSRRMGYRGNNSVNHVIKGRPGHIANPSVKWLSRFAYACGGRLLIEFPAQEVQEDE